MLKKKKKKLTLYMYIAYLIKNCLRIVTRWFHFGKLSFSYLLWRWITEGNILFVASSLLWSFLAVAYATLRIIASCIGERRSRW